MSQEERKQFKFKIYRCESAGKNEACGFNGTSYDLSRDECHHMMDRKEAEFLAIAGNAFYPMREALEEMRDKFKVLIFLGFGKTPPPSHIVKIINKVEQALKLAREGEGKS